MKRTALLVILSLCCHAAFAQNDSVMVQRIRDEIMLHGACYNNLRVLTKTIGHRISGSPEAARAVQWGRKAMREAGADSVWLQPVWVPHWVRGKESLKLKLGSGNFEPVRMLSLGNTVGSGGKIMEAPIVMVRTMDELKGLTRAQAAGKIVFVNYRFRQDIINTFEGYGDAVKFRGAAPVLVASKGGIAVIIRSISTGADDVPHTGVTRYADTVTKIPAVAIGNATADRLEAAMQQGGAAAQVFASGRMADSVLSYNVIGELRGSERPDEFVIAGGHLDSWDVGEGAQDDGAGDVQSIEILRTFKALGIRPKRSVRAVLFMNEENGAKGGRAYADSARARREKHVLAIESDAGGFSPRGIGLVMAPEKKAVILRWAPLFATMGAYDFSLEDGGTDIDPLKNLGTPLASLIPDPQRYFDQHHTDNDVFETVSHRELKLGAAVMASLIYLVSEHGL